MDQLLLSAAEEGDIWTVCKITQKCPDIDVNVKSEHYKDSALALACKGVESLEGAPKFLPKLPPETVAYIECQKSNQSCDVPNFVGGHYNIAKTLIEAGAKIDAANSLGVTPLHWAAKGGHTKVIKLLVINEASLDSVNLNGIPPIGFTAYNGTNWKILQEAKKGKMPVIVEPNPVPVIPEYAIQAGMPKPKKEKTKKGKGKGKGKGKKKKK